MYTTFFANNKTYGADDINKVFAHLTTQGVSLYKDTGETLIDLDTALANMVNAGVDRYNVNSCKVVALGNKKFKISKGCCWMPSGACIIFDDDGYTFESNYTADDGTNSATCYVYLKQGGAEFATVSNDINIVVSGTAPAETDMILATINSSGTITDKRTISQAKIAVPTSNIITEKSVYLTYQPDNEHYSYTVSVDIGYPGFKYIYDTYGMSVTYDGDKWARVVELTDSFKIISRYTYDWIYARKTGSQTVEFYGYASLATSYSSKTINFIVF